MPLVVVGVSHKTAPVELREKLALNPQTVEQILKERSATGPIKEMTVLSTCNRTELYGFSESEVQDHCRAFFRERLSSVSADQFVYVKSEQDMVRHLFSVSSGLDSLVVGENEILKQVKDAYQLAHRSGTTGKIFNVLFQRALYVGKLVRTRTAIGQGATSVGSVAVSLSEKIFGDLSGSSVLILGAGKMAEVSARYLVSKKVKNLRVANRTLEHARELAEKFQGTPLSLEDGFKQMTETDIVITSVSVPEPILTRRHVAELMRQRRNRSLFIVDIAMPRNVEPSVHGIDNVYLYNIDDLKSIADENMSRRADEVEKAGQMVAEMSSEFFDWYCSLKTGSEKSLKHGDRYELQSD